MKLLLLLPIVLSSAQAAGKVDFRREVRPILSDACFHCHGPDKGSRMAGLRLDLKAEAFQARKNGAPIVPGKPEASLILQRIRHEKAALRMPPPAAHKTLTPAQVETIERWIAQGADWQEHWAFSPPVKVEPPAVKNAGWAKNEIDRFLLGRLEQVGLTPAPVADKRTLARRVSLDLTGLPPEPADVEAFLKDERPDAYERLVDKYLASPHYGEHRARYWLDASRYADTHGLHIDNYREIWIWRDWVIQSYNKNQPFDQFTVDQLAGDLLPNATMEQVIASGFHRNNVTTNEGGVIEDEVAAMNAKDRADTTGTVFLGLTVGCATCHDHKFDPITQKDFYSMTAFFRNTTQRPLDGNVSDTPPVIFLPNAKDAARWPGIENELVALQGKMGGRVDQLRGHQQKVAALPKSLTPVWNWDMIDFAKGAKMEQIPGFDKINPDRPFTLSMWVYYPKPDDNWTLLSQYDGNEKESSKLRGWTLDIQGRQPVFKFWGDEGAPIVARSGNAAKMMPGNWYHVAFTYDGQRKKRSSFELYFNGTRIAHEGKQDNPRSMLIGPVANDQPLRIGGDGGKRTFTGGALEDVKLYDRVLSSQEISLVEMYTRVKKAKPGELLDERAKLYAATKDGTFKKLLAQLTTVEAERKAMQDRGAITHVMVEKPDSKAVAKVLFRGMYDQPRDEVEANVPVVLGGLDSGLPKNRLGLAQWLLKPENPLFARVAVNRYWQEVFGTGLVRTSEDFGSQGEAPVNPELLDWLAIRYRESGWDTKAFFKLLVMSAAYQQQAVATEEKLKKDPENRLLSRGPRFRMDAEMVRDYALAASGLLVRKIGGPSVRPYQPEKIWETVAMKESDTRFYVQDHGDALYRRSMYTFWKRSAPPPAMDLFNAPTRETCTVRRERTNTPLQALLTMNDVQFVEAARRLAERAMEAHKNNFDAQLDYLSERLVTRRFSEAEREVSRAAYRDYLRYYDSNPAMAKKLISTGESAVNAKLPAPELAALTMLSNQLLNLDEVLTK